MAYTNEALGKALEDLTAAYQHFIDRAQDAAIAAMSDTVIAHIKQDAKEHITSELAEQKSALEKAIEAAKKALHNSATEADTVLKQTAEAKKNELASLIAAAENALNEKGAAVENALNEKSAAALQEIKTTSEKERLGLEKIKDKINAAVRDLYEVCASGAEEKIKTVNIADFTLKNGVKICVKFTNGNTADEPRLNVSGTIDKPITMDGTPVYTGCFDAGGVYEFIYDGEHWECVSGTVRTQVLGVNSGYIKYRNGLIYQWLLYKGTGGTIKIPFPISFSRGLCSFHKTYLDCEWSEVGGNGLYLHGTIWCNLTEFVSWVLNNTTVSFSFIGF